MKIKLIGHIKSQICCAIYCYWVEEILFENESILLDPFLSCRASLNGCIRSRIGELPTPFFDELGLEDAYEAFNEIQRFDNPQGTGYVVDCLHSALKCVVENDNYEDTVKAAIAMGNDTDTTAAVAGGMAGALYGINGIPQRWLDALRGRDIVDPMLEKLLEHRS